MDVSKLNKDDVNSKCVAYLRDYSADMSKLQTAREEAMKAYMCEPYGNEVVGRSQVVMSDVFNTIESILPSLMRIFCGGIDVVKVSGQGPEDEEGATLMGELLNHQSRKDFNAFTLLYDWFKDALLCKMGVVKYYWVKETKYKRKDYQGITPEELNALLAKGNYEVTKQSSDSDGVYLNIEGRTVTRISKPMVEVLPPEEFIFNVRAKTLSESFCAHKKKVHKKSLSKYGVKEADVADAITEMSGENLINERFKDLGGAQFITDNPEDDEVYIYECYYNVYKEDGEPVPIKALIMGGQVIDLEENKYGKPPFRELSAIRLTHRAVGRSFYDLAGEVQKLKTALVRYILDNIYYQNNGQKVVNPYKINMDDLFSQNRPGGVIRTLDISTPVGDAIMPVPTTPLAPQAFSFLEYADGSILENRTGVTRYNQGLDSESLNKTASGISQIMSASQQRIELIARIFAETGVKGLFEDIAQMNLDFFDKPTNIKLNEEWKTINPEDISGEYDININVGIGTGTKEMVVQQLMTMLDVYLKGLTETGIVSPENVTELIKSIWENMGFKNADKYITTKDANAEPPPVDPAQEEALAMQKKIALLEVEKLKNEIVEIRTKGILNLANAAKAEMGEQFQQYSDQYETLGGEVDVQQPIQPEAEGSLDTAGGNFPGGAGAAGLAPNSAVLPAGGEGSY